MERGDRGDTEKSRRESSRGKEDSTAERRRKVGGIRDQNEGNSATDYG